MRGQGPKKTGFGSSELSALGTMTVTTEEWRARCTSMRENVEKLQDENRKLDDDIEQRQESYISREQEYRATIE